MKIILTTISTLLLIFSAAKSQQYFGETPDDGLTVNGIATVSFKADVGYLNLSYVSGGILLKDVLDRGETELSDLRKKITEKFPEITEFEYYRSQIGEESRQISYSQDRDEYPRPEARYSILIKTKPEEALLAEITDFCIRNGALLPQTYGYSPQSQLMTFGIADDVEAEYRAFDTALANARSTAERVAELSGVTLGPIISVDARESSSRIARYVLGQNDVWREIKHSSNDPNKIFVYAEVVVRFQLLEK